jgi:hypothetical protein
MAEMADEKGQDAPVQRPSSSRRTTVRATALTNGEGFP